MSHYDEEIDKSFKWLHFHFLYTRNIRPPVSLTIFLFLKHKSHSSYDVLIGKDGKPINAKTGKIEIMPISLNLQCENLGFILW